LIGGAGSKALNEVGRPRTALYLADYRGFNLRPTTDVTGHSGMKAPQVTFNSDATGVRRHFVGLLAGRDDGRNHAGALSAEYNEAHFCVV
jgi:hypothetical protein